MIELAAIALLAGQSAPAARTPDYQAVSSMDVRAAAQCVHDNLRGKRLGFNVMTLRPALLTVGSGEVVEVGPQIRFAIEPTAEGSRILLYSRSWTARLASFIRPCVDLEPSGSGEGPV